MLSVSEIFHSLQGEGPNLGTPTVFLRTAGCNLRCTWCDTPYALELRQGTRRETADIVEEIQSFNTPHLVVTGGEPMIQQIGLREVLKELKGYFVEIETNGGFASEIDEYIDQYNCSPKLAGSGNKPYELKLLPNKKTWYKFVVGSDADFEEVRACIEKYQLPQDRVQLMPLGQTKRELEQTSGLVADLCKQHGYLFSPRLHVSLWGNTMGT